MNRFAMVKMMELRHLRYFLILAEELNFTKAASRLMIAQPPLSRQIRDLEEELGTPLFVRGHHALSLTEEGVLFKDYASRIIALSDQSVSDIRNMRKGLQGTICLAEVEGKGPRLMARWIAEFSRFYPSVKYTLWNGNSDEVANRIRKGLSDVAVIMEPHDPRGIHSFPVYNEPWIVMCRTDHPIAGIGQDRIPVSALAGQELIIPSRDSRLQEIMDWFGPEEEKPVIRARIANVVTAYELCREGVGAAIYPAAAADIVTDHETICIKTIEDDRIRASYVLIYPDEHPLSELARRFVEFIKDRESSLKTKN